MADIARTLNSRIEIVLRPHSEDETRLFRKDGIGKVFFGEEELASGMTRHIVERFRRSSPGGQLDHDDRL